MEPNHEILTDYLDRQLNPAISSQVENMVKENKVAAADLQYLKLAIDTVRQDAVRQKVSAIRQSFEKNQARPVKQANGMVRSMYRISMRVAAILIIVAGVAFFYKYISVSSRSVYENQFTGYELNNTRGQEKTDGESEAYQNKNWSGVISIYNGEATHSNKSSFLAAMAEMQQNHFPQAVAIFENLRNASGKSKDYAFKDETEYYLSLAYLMNHEEIKSVFLMDYIKSDPSHTYYPMVSRISSIDLKIIELKNKK